MKSKRIEWIDLAKVVTMYLVVFGHLGVDNEIADGWVHSFHVPAFFFLSGLFASVKLSLYTSIKRDMHRLLLPVLLWHVLGMFTWDIVQVYVLHRGTFVQTWIEQQCDFLIGRECGFGWFMLALFWMRLIYHLIHNFSQRIQVIIAFGVFPLAACMLYDVVTMPFYVLQSLMSFPFYYAGHLLKKQIMREDRNVWIITSAFVVGIAVTFALLTVNGVGSPKAMGYGKSVIGFYAQGFIGTLVVLSLCQLLQRCKLPKAKEFINTIGEGTIVILLFQPPFLFVAKVAYKIIVHPTHRAPYYSVIGAIIATMLIMMVMYPCIRFINRYLPMLNGR